MIASKSNSLPSSRPLSSTFNVVSLRNADRVAGDSRNHFMNAARVAGSSNESDVQSCASRSIISSSSEESRLMLPPQTRILRCPTVLNPLDGGSLHYYCLHFLKD